MNPVALPLSYNLVQLLELEHACICIAIAHHSTSLNLFGGFLIRCQRWEVYSSAAGGSTGVSNLHRHVRGKYQPEFAITFLSNTNFYLHSLSY